MLIGYSCVSRGATGPECSTTRGPLVLPGHAAGSLAEDEHAIAQEDGLVDVVCHEEDREPVLLPDARQELLHELARLGVEGAERLVHEQYLWTVRERPGDGNTLAHPAGELARIRVGELVETDECEML